MQSEDQQRLVIQLLRQHEQQQKPQHGGRKQQQQAPPTPPMIHAVRFRLPKESNTEQGGLKAKLLPSSLRGSKNKEKSSTGSRGREGILSHFRWPRSRSAERAISRDKNPEVKPEETNKRRTWFFTETSV